MKVLSPSVKKISNSAVPTISVNLLNYSLDHIGVRLLDSSVNVDNKIYITKSQHTIFCCESCYQYLYYCKYMIVIIIKQYVM